MKHRFLLTILVCIISFNPFVVLSQKNFQPGFVVTIEGDTIKGLIDYKNWNQNPTKIKFKLKEDSEINDFGKLEIKSFFVANEIYEKHIVSVDISPYFDLDGLRFEPSPLMNEDTCFLMLIVRGKANLYYFKDQFDKEHFFVKKGDTQIEELINYRYYTKEDEFSGRTIKKNEKFKGQLIYYFSDYQEVTGRLESTVHKISSLKKLFTFYNKHWENEVPIYSKDTKKIKTQLAVGLGITYTGIDILIHHDRFNEFSKSLDPTFGMSVNFVFPRGREKLNAFADLYMKSYSCNYQYENYINDEYYDRYEWTFGKVYVKTGAGIRYKLVNKKFSPSIFSGLFFAKAILNKSKAEELHVFYSTQRRESRDYVFQGESNREAGIFGGVGLSHKKFTFDFRYEYAIALIDLIGKQAHSKTISCVLSYSFF